MSLEHPLQNEILLAVCRGKVRLFRNNVGVGWLGGPTEHKAGTVILHNARPLHAGLVKGSGDLIGWRTVEITPDMVGQRVAVFASIEVKGTGGKPRPEQLTWLDNVRAAGGIACIAYSVEDARKAFNV